MSDRNYDPSNRNEGGRVGPHIVTITMEIPNGGSVTVTRDVRTEYGMPPESVRRQMVRMIDGLVVTLGGWGLDGGAS